MNYVKTCSHWRRQLWGTGARAPLPDFQQFNFSGDFRAIQTLTFDFVWLPVKEYRSIALSLFTAWIS